MLYCKLKFKLLIEDEIFIGILEILYPPFGTDTNDL